MFKTHGRVSLFFDDSLLIYIHLAKESIIILLTIILTVGHKHIIFSRCRPLHSFINFLHFSRANLCIQNFYIVILMIAKLLLHCSFYYNRTIFTLFFLWKPYYFYTVIFMITVLHWIFMITVLLLHWIVMIPILHIHCFLW